MVAAVDGDVCDLERTEARHLHRDGIVPRLQKGEGVLAGCIGFSVPGVVCAQVLYLHLGSRNDCARGIRNYAGNIGGVKLGMSLKNPARRKQHADAQSLTHKRHTTPG